LSQSRATYPLIAYIPDARTPQPDNTFTLAELASHGFVLAAIQNAFSGSRKNEANIDDPSRTSDDPNARMVRCGVRAACALLDALGNLRSDGPAGEWAGKMDLQRVGIMGYALGGTVAHASAIREPRYVAAISLDGARVTNTPDDVPYMQLRSEASDAIDASTAPPNGSVLTSGLVDAPLPLSHIIEIAGSCPEHFTDWLVTASACAREPFRAMAARIRTILDTYTVAFFETYVLGTPHPLICVRHSPFPEVRFLAPLYSAHQSESPRRKSKLH
jgi:pimeloyl-ACP methyl ester carboxylesterase